MKKIGLTLFLFSFAGLLFTSCSGGDGGDGSGGGLPDVPFTWQAKTNCPSVGLRRSMIFPIGSTIYYISEMDVSNGYNGYVYGYDMTANTWTAKQAFNVSGVGDVHYGIVVDGDIHVMENAHIGYDPYVFCKYSVTGNTWGASTIPVPSELSPYVAATGRLMTLGTNHYCFTQSALKKLDLSTTPPSWTSVVSTSTYLPTFSNIAVLGSSAYAYNTDETIYEFSAATNTWTPKILLSSLDGFPKNAAALGGIVFPYDNHIYVYSYYSNQNGFKQLMVAKYNPSDNSVEFMEDPNFPIVNKTVGGGDISTNDRCNTVTVNGRTFIGPFSDAKYYELKPL